MKHFCKRTVFLSCLLSSMGKGSCFQIFLNQGKASEMDDHFNEQGQQEDRTTADKIQLFHGLKKGMISLLTYRQVVLLKLLKGGKMENKIMKILNQSQEKWNGKYSISLKILLFLLGSEFVSHGFLSTLTKVSLVTFSQGELPIFQIVQKSVFNQRSCQYPHSYT